jgi:hypothetical protein
MDTPKIEVLIDGQPADEETIQTLEAGIEALHDRVSAAYSGATRILGAPDRATLNTWVAELDRLRRLENALYTARADRPKVTA